MKSPAVYERCVNLIGISGCSEYSFVSHQCYYPLYTYNYFFRKMDLISFIQWIKSLQNEGILFSEYQIIGELRSLNEKLEPIYFANKDIRTLSDFRIKSVSLSQSIQDWKSKRSLFSWIYYKMLGGFYFK